MGRIVVLDSGPLGDASKPRGKPKADRCLARIGALCSAGVLVVAPAIADYEVRRELIRVGAADGLARLDRLIAESLVFAPITDEAMRLAAGFWALIRNRGLPTAAPAALDGDAILAAQASLIGGPADEILIATTNVGHHRRFPGIDAREWDSIVWGSPG